jgi:hypothetical protein
MSIRQNVVANIAHLRGSTKLVFIANVRNRRLKCIYLYEFRDSYGGNNEQ